MKETDSSLTARLAWKGLTAQSQRQHACSLRKLRDVAVQPLVIFNLPKSCLQYSKFKN